MVKTPEMSTETELGAAPWASAAMGWKGNMKLLQPKPVKSSAKARIMVGFMLPGSRAEICARFSVWHWAYTSAVPSKTQLEPMEPTTRYLKAASRALGFQVRKAVRPTAAKVMTSSIT